MEHTDTKETESTMSITEAQEPEEKKEKTTDFLTPTVASSLLGLSLLRLYIIWDNGGQKRHITVPDILLPLCAGVHMVATTYSKPPPVGNETSKDQPTEDAGPKKASYTDVFGHSLMTVFQVVGACFMFYSWAFQGGELFSLRAFPFLLLAIGRLLFLIDFLRGEWKPVFKDAFEDAKDRLLHPSLPSIASVAVSIAGRNVSAEIMAMAAIIRLSVDTQDVCSIWHDWQAMFSGCFFAFGQIYWRERTDSEDEMQFESVLVCIVGTWVAFHI